MLLHVADHFYVCVDSTNQGKLNIANLACHSKLQLLLLLLLYLLKKSISVVCKIHLISVI